MLERQIEEGDEPQPSWDSTRFLPARNLLVAIVIASLLCFAWELAWPMAFIEELLGLSYAGTTSAIFSWLCRWAFWFAVAGASALLVLPWPSPASPGSPARACGARSCSCSPQRRAACSSSPSCTCSSSR